MSHFGDGKGSWQPRESLTHHLATHTPIQATRQPDGVSPAFHSMQHQTAWYPSFVTPQTHILRPAWTATASEWPAAANNNTSKTEWDKWSPPGLEVQRPLPQLPLPAPSPIQPKVEKEDPMTIDPVYHSPKEDEGVENHTASYDNSASQSPSETDESREPRATSEEHVDVERTPPPQDANSVIVATSSQEVSTTNDDEEKDQLMVDESASEATEAVAPRKEDEASHLLLNFSQQSYAASSTTESSPDKVEFSQSNNSAFSNPEPQPTQETQPESNGSFCRPPGLGPSNVPPTSGANGPLVCPICGFSSPSKFHYNSHMNTHGDHQCSMCDYTSRTEGRLKKHMKESHTIEEQIAAGLEIDSKTPSSPAAPSSNSSNCSMAANSLSDTSALSTTMASLVDAANAAAAGTSAEMPTVSTIASALSMDNIVNPSNLLNSLAPTGLGPSAMDQIRAFAEKSSIIPENRINLATALGAMSQMDESPDRLNSSSNSEPRRNSNGKIKQLKCKQCPHVSYSKDDQWNHSRSHIPLDKQMNCPQCNFVTEYKHHLEYHIRNHLGSKPFQCKKCSYQCVNKSMLNSHMKSHTNVYQFRCMDCTYATKYCHSLKLHLKKYDHRRIPDGLENGENSSSQSEPNGLPSYLTTPFRPNNPATSLAQTLGLSAPIVTSQSLTYASQMLLRQHQMEQMNNLMNINGLANMQQPQQKCNICDFSTSSQDELMRHNMSHIINANQSPIVSLYQSLPQMSALLPQLPSHDAEENVNVDTQGDNESGNAGDDEMEGSSGCTGSPLGSSKGCSGDEAPKRKGFKVDQIGERLLGKSPSASECGSHVEEKEEPMDQSEGLLQPTPQLPISTAFAQLMPEHKINFFQQGLFASLFNQQPKREDWSFQCQHCRMAFQEQALYQIHMGYHGYEAPFKCNRCGYMANCSLTFNLHLLQASHE